MNMLLLGCAARDGGAKSNYYDVIHQRDQTAEEIRPNLAIRESAMEVFRKQLLEQTYCSAQCYYMVGPRDGDRDRLGLTPNSERRQLILMVVSSLAFAVR